jgi:hypothetical protein
MTFNDYAGYLVLALMVICACIMVGGSDSRD